MTDWRHLASRAADLVGTPCYMIVEDHIDRAIDELKGLQSSIPLRHWLSLKTQPVGRLVRFAVDRGFGIDVVSDYELRAALAEGVPPGRILVNGIGKHRWLADFRIRDLSVHFDSIAEVQALTHLSRVLGWRVGLRCAVPDMFSADATSTAHGWNQFGLNRDEMQLAASMLTGAGVAISGLHFHLHTAVSDVDEYRRALSWLADVARSVGIRPSYVDVGGGLPIDGELSLEGISAASTFDLADFRKWLASIPAAFPSIDEVWLENGRFLSGPSGALVVGVVDRKLRGDVAYLICDGGRVNHARMASLERHELVVVSNKEGREQKTIVCGPTCGAVDRLGCWMLPESVGPGDRLMWLNAGAYHIPLETRFSMGLAPVVWFDHRQEPAVIRRRETPDEWWGQWLRPGRDRHSASGRVEARVAGGGFNERRA